MAEVHGSKLVMTFNAVNITTAYMRDDVEYSDGERDLLDNTNYGATADSHNVSPIRKGVPIQIGGTWSTESHAALAPLIGTKAALVIQPNGTTTGNPKLTGNATLRSYKVKSSVTDDTKWSGELVPDDGLTWGTNP